MNNLVLVIRLLESVCRIWLFASLTRSFWRMRNAHSVFSACWLFFTIMLLGSLWMASIDIMSIMNENTSAISWWGVIVYRGSLVIGAGLLVNSLRLR